MSGSIPRDALTVEAENGWRERRRVWERELHSVFFRSLQELWGLVAFLFVSLLLAFLLFPSQCLLRLFFLGRHKERTVRCRLRRARNDRNIEQIKHVKKKPHSLFSRFASSFQLLQLLLLFLILLQELLLLLYIHLLKRHYKTKHTSLLIQDHTRIPTKTCHEFGPLTVVAPVVIEFLVVQVNDICTDIV